jgi:predicted thioesterase
VANCDTAASIGSGVVDVLGTPRLIALCEVAAVKAVEHQLEPGQASVALNVRFDHLRPTAVGQTITAEATLDRIDGRRLSFTVSAKDDRGLVGAGKITRVIVDIERFMDKTR